MQGQGRDIISNEDLRSFGMLELETVSQEELASTSMNTFSGQRTIADRDGREHQDPANVTKEDPGPTTTGNLAKDSFLDLPPEIRTKVYDYLLQPAICSRYEYAGPYARYELQYCPTYVSLVEYWERETGQTWSGPYKKWDVFPDYLLDDVRTVMSLMKTCRLLRTEVAPRFFPQVTFLFSNEQSFKHFRRSLTATVRPLIQKLIIAGDDFHHTTLALALPTSLDRFSNLRDLVLDRCDASANKQEKGTEWKPYVLRALQMIPEVCPNLTKSYCCITSISRSCMGVRFCVDDSQPFPDEKELDLNAEYKKWLEANWERRSFGDVQGRRAKYGLS